MPVCLHDRCAYGWLGLQEWSDLMHTVKGVLWVDSVYTGSDELIRDEVMQIVSNKSWCTSLFETSPAGLEGFPHGLEIEIE